MWTLFESRHQREKDLTEIRRLFDKYGEDAVGILQSRTKASVKSKRDHTHWRRLLGKAKRYRRYYRAQQLRPAE